MKEICMRLVYGSTFALALALLVPSGMHAQMDHGQMQETARKVENGGVHAAGWQGMVDPTASGQSVNDAKLEMQGKDLHVVTGPAIAYWNPANKASGDYTVKATFSEPKYMNLNDHPHPYGIVIGGNDMGTPQATYLYCAAYGNGTFIVRGFGPAAFALGGRRPTANDAVHKAAAKDQPVTQEIAMSVKGDNVTCSINGTQVASFPKSEVVGEGKLKSLDGVYGIRFAHNTEGTVSGLSLSK
jgi:hypothetical protein